MISLTFVYCYVQCPLNKNKVSRPFVLGFPQLSNQCKVMQIQFKDEMVCICTVIVAIGNMAPEVNGLHSTSSKMPSGRLHHVTAASS